MDAGEMQAAQSVALEFCQQQLRQAAVHGQGLLQRLAELTADADSREAEMQALRERCADLQSDNERLRLQISACRHQFDMEILQCMALQSRCDELTAELDRCQRGLHMEEELLQARQQIQMLQQSCDSERRLKQAAEQRCESVTRDLNQYRDQLAEMHEDKNRAQGLMALTRARAPARKQGADEALVAEVRELKAQLDDARRLNTLMRIASMVSDTSSEPAPVLSSPHTSLAVKNEGAQQLTAGVVSELESRGSAAGGAGIDIKSSSSNSSIDNSSGSVTATAVASETAIVTTPSKDCSPPPPHLKDCSPPPPHLKQPSWPPQPDDSPPLSNSAPSSAPQILRDFFALSVVCCCMAQPELHSTADVKSLMETCLREAVPLHEWRDWIHRTLQRDPSTPSLACASPASSAGSSAAAAASPPSATKRLMKMLERKRVEANCVRMVQEASALVTKILTVNAGLEAELQAKDERMQEVGWEIQELQEVVAAKNDVIAHLMSSLKG